MQARFSTAAPTCCSETTSKYCYLHKVLPQMSIKHELYKNMRNAMTLF